MKQNVISMLACPHCHQALILNEERQYLICQNEQLAYPIVNGIPALLPENATPLKPTVENDMKEVTNEF